MRAIVVIGIIIFVAMFVFAILSTFNPKVRGWMLSKHVKAKKYMMEESKDDIKSISDDMAEATKDGIETTMRSIKKGLSEDKIYCKFCGELIDKNSKFCSHCGKEL